MEFTNQEALQFAISALGGCLVAIGWWIGTSLASLNDKMGRVLIRIESHDVRISNLEKQVK